MSQINDDPWAPGVGLRGEEEAFMDHSLIVKAVRWLRRLCAR